MRKPKPNFNLPWRIKGEHIIDSRGLFVAKVGKTGRSAVDAEHKQIQQHIVHAANLYDVLLAAVRIGLQEREPYEGYKTTILRQAFEKASEQILPRHTTDREVHHGPERKRGRVSGTLHRPHGHKPVR